MKRIMAARFTLLACLWLNTALISCSEEPLQRPRTVGELEQLISGKNNMEMAQFIFDNYNCKSCHTLETEGKFGFTSRGEQLREGFEGCVALLTAVQEMVYLPEEQRTPEQKDKFARFKEFGCTSCHQVLFGSVGLTEIGARLAFLHLSCGVVQETLNRY